MNHESYHIFYHDDVDGVVSAAMYLNYYLMLSGSYYQLHPMSSSSRGHLFGKMIDKISRQDNHKIIILDYEGDERAHLWVDHHYDRTVGQQPVFTEKIQYDPNSKSAAELLLRLINDEDFPDTFIDDVNMIDSADYPDVKYVFENQSPLMILMSYMENTYPNPHTFNRIVEVVAHSHMDFRKANYILEINPQQVMSTKLNRVAECKRHMVIVGDLSVVNQKRPDQFPRYSEYMVRPETKYQVRLTPASNNKTYLQLGANLWGDQKNRINVGKALRSMEILHKGGGHFNVGGGVFDTELKDKVLIKLCEIFNEGKGVEELMEKYGVDSSDPVEKAAEEIEKTGESGNRSEAREKAAKKIEPKKYRDE